MGRAVGAGAGFETQFTLRDAVAVDKWGSITLVTDKRRRRSSPGVSLESSIMTLTRLSLRSVAKQSRSSLTGAEYWVRSCYSPS